MVDHARQWYERLHVERLLNEHRGLRIVPSRGEDLVLTGPLRFRVTGPVQEVIDDEYDIEMRISPRFPQELPTVRELGGRIPETWHKLVGNLLCLGSPTAIRLKLSLSPTLPTLVNALVIPYLYGRSYYAKHGRMPYGELAHGDEGIRQCLAEFFGARGAVSPEEFLRLAGLKKRNANKKPCPCGSGRRLGRCHNRQVNRLRKQMGRQWFEVEYVRVVNTLKPAKPVSVSQDELARGRGRRPWVL